MKEFANDRYEIQNDACRGRALASLTSAPAASSRVISGVPGQDFVNVNVSMNMQFPLADDSTEAMDAAQVDGRKLLYRLATSECPVLLETIAQTCRLTNLNVSTQVRHQSGNVPLMLHLNGNAQFAITLKGNDGPAQ